MIYCMSDLHGRYDLFYEMLHKIEFSGEDHLYVIGDIIDRGSRGIDIALDIMARPNVTFLLGNHEYMCLDVMRRGLEDARERWMRNRGGRTRSDLIYKRTAEVRRAVLDYFDNAPTCLDVEVNGRKFHLVHGGPAETVHDRVWNRLAKTDPAPMTGVTVIFGHTPTYHYLPDDGQPLRIWHGDGMIGIDCGCGHSAPISRLSCLRLDDMTEFYLDAKM